MSQITTERVPIATVHKDERNARRHSKKNLDAIKASLAEFGQQKPIVVDADGRVLAGNGTLDAALALGWTEIDIARTDLLGARARAFAVADNRTAELAEWDDAILAEALAAIQADEDLESICTGFDENEIERAITRGTGAGAVDEDEVPEPPVEPVTKRGDLWLLGDHRLLCGDSTKAEDVARVMAGEKAVLMNTDPPYGIDYIQLKKGMPGFRFSNDVVDGDIENDTFKSDDQLQEFLETAIRMAVPHLTENAAFYLWHPMLTQGTFFAAAAAAAAADILIHRQIVWVKPGFVLTRSGMYHWKHELCFYGWMRGHVPPWYGDKSQVSVWMLGRDEDHGEHHPTQKPVALFAIPMQNHTRKGEVC